MKSSARFLLFAVFAIAIFASPAHADVSPSWSSTGIGCVPAPTASGLINIVNSSVRFATGQTGDFQLYCPVTHLTGYGDYDPNNLAFTVFDTTGSGSDGYVRASLYRMSVTTGAVTQIGTTMESDDGDSEEATSVSHTFDFLSYYYFVKIDMHRTSTTYSPVFYGVRLYLSTI